MSKTSILTWCIQHMHEITNLSIGHQSCKRIMTEKTLLHNFVCFQMHINKRLQLSFSFIIGEKLHLSQLLQRESRFSQCFLLATALHCSLQVNFCLKKINYFEPVPYCDGRFLESDNQPTRPSITFTFIEQEVVTVKYTPVSFSLPGK